MRHDIDPTDDVFRGILIEALKPYTEAARKWWAEYEQKTFSHTSVFPVKDGPPGFMEKISRSPRQSCIYGVQAFPIVSVAYLQLPRMVGGAMQLVEQIAKNGLIIEEFTVVVKAGLQSTLRNGMFLCYVPTTMLQKAPMARWVYMRPHELLDLANGIVTSSLAERVAPFAHEYSKEIAYEHRED